MKMALETIEIPTNDQITANIETLRNLLKVSDRQKPEKPVRRRFRKKDEKVKEHYHAVIDNLNMTRKIARLSLHLNIELVEAILEEPELRAQNTELKNRVDEHDEIMLKIHEQFKTLYKITRIATRAE